MRLMELANTQIGWLLMRAIVSVPRVGCGITYAARELRDTSSRSAAELTAARRP